MSDEDILGINPQIPPNVRLLILDFELNKTDASKGSLDADRAYKLDAILVRIMKGRGTM